MKQDNIATEHTSGDSQPWYKNGIVLLVISIPALAVVMSLTTAYFAVFGGDTLVRDHYYKDGLAINQELDYETHAQALGVTAQLMLDEKTGVISVQLSGYDDFPSVLSLQLLHPTVAEKDQDVVLKHSKQGSYTGIIKSALQGRYHLQLMSESQKWRLKAYREIGSSQSYSLP